MKKLFVFAALILIIAAGIFAQTFRAERDNVDLPGSIGMPGLTSSPQFTATQGRFRSAADNFIRPDYYNAVTFDKFYAMASFAANIKAQLGYAGKIGNLYIAAAYSGSFWAGYTTFNYNEDRRDWYGTGVDETIPVYGFTPANPFDNSTPENRIAILLGVANMGFRFTFSSVGHEYKGIKEDFAIGPTLYKSYEAERGGIIPQIAWALAKDLTENGIRPYVLLDLGFARENIKYESYITGTTTTGVIIENSENHFDPKLTLGLGGYTFYKSSGNFRLLADFEYALKLKIYENEYNYTDSSLNLKTSKINGRNANNVLSEDTFNSHRFTPALAGQWSGGPLALRFRLNLPVILYGEESTPYSRILTSTSGELEEDPTRNKTSTFFIGFIPALQLAAQWQIVSKLTLNIGGQVSFGVGRTTIDTDYKATPGPGGRAAYRTQRIQEWYGDTGNALTIGFTFLPTDNLTFEASSGIFVNTNNNNVISFTSDSGVLTFTSLLVGVKF